MKRFWLVLAVFLGFVSTTAPAFADLTYTLNYDSTSGSPMGPGFDYGTVMLHQTSSTVVTVTVQLKTSIAGIGFANSSAGVSAAFDLSGSAPDNIAINALTPNASNFAPVLTSGAYLGAYKAAPFTSGANGNKFQYAIDYSGASSAGQTKLVFDVTRNSGLLITDFVANPNYLFAVDIITTAGATRDVAVPEPGTWTMAIAGLAGLAGLAMLRRRKLARA